MTPDETMPRNADAVEVLRSALKTQYHAGLAMLRQAIERCPDDLWTVGSETNSAYANPFWRVAYHTLYYVHLYIQPEASDFRPWAYHQTRIQDLDEYPAPPGSSEDLTQIGTVALVLRLGCSSMPPGIKSHSSISAF